ncbi:MAG: methyltransferase [Candidatus Aenigmarchaeota archaeon]|nr:methyltransferase [Candidatus Aenigmarchaeota archaeon]
MIFRYKGFSIETDENVYEPSDDTYILLDSLEKVGIRPGFRVLEVGCGTGIISIALSGRAASVVACDINPHAVDVCKRNAARNKVKNVEVAGSDLFSGVSGKFDLIVFNTPYLPQSLDETVSGEINYAWDGGVDGRKVIERFLAEVSSYLFEGGRIVFLESSLSDYEKSLSYLESAGFKVKIINRLKLHFEELVVIEAVRG